MTNMGSKLDQKRTIDHFQRTLNLDGLSKT